MGMGKRKNTYKNDSGDVKEEDARFGVFIIISLQVVHSSECSRLLILSFRGK